MRPVRLAPQLAATARGRCGGRRGGATPERDAPVTIGDLAPLNGESFSRQHSAQRGRIERRVEQQRPALLHLRGGFHDGREGLLPRGDHRAHVEANGAWLLDGSGVIGPREGRG